MIQLLLFVLISLSTAINLPSSKNSNSAESFTRVTLRRENINDARLHGRLLSCKTNDCQSSYYCSSNIKAILLGQSSENIAQHLNNDVELNADGLIFIVCQTTSEYNNNYAGFGFHSEFKVVRVSQMRSGKFMLDNVASMKLSNQFLKPNITVTLRKSAIVEVIVTCEYEFNIRQILNISLYSVKHNVQNIINLQVDKFRARFTSGDTKVRVEYEHVLIYNDAETPYTSFTCELFNQNDFDGFRTSVNSQQIPLLENVPKQDIKRDENYTVTNWSAWSVCTGTCVRGIRKRWRNCTSERNILQSQCIYLATQETGLCPPYQCQLPYWTMWSKWEVCKSTCSDSVISRTRNCKDFKYNVRSECKGESLEAKKYSVVCKEDGRNRRSSGSNCRSIKDKCPNSPSGIYSPMNLCYNCDEKVSLYCDMKTRGQAWTVIQRRVSSNVSFARTWKDYKNGFGQLDKDFWLGNEIIRQLSETYRVYLRIDLWFTNNSHRFAEYGPFKVGRENSYYQLTIGKYFGNAGDALSNLNNTQFSTIDFNNRFRSTLNNHGLQYNSTRTEGFWLYDSNLSNLNGKYDPTGKSKANGMFWGPEMIPLKKVEIKISV